MANSPQCVYSQICIYGKGQSSSQLWSTSASECMVGVRSFFVIICQAFFFVINIVSFFFLILFILIKSVQYIFINLISIKFKYKIQVSYLFSFLSTLNLKLDFYHLCDCCI